MPAIRIAAAITTDNPELLTRAIEAWTRAAAGLALDGATVDIYIGAEEDETADTQAEEQG